MKAEIQRIIQAFSKSKAGYIKISINGELLEIVKPKAHNQEKQKRNTIPVKIPEVPYELISKNVGRYIAPESVLQVGQKINIQTKLGAIESMGLRHNISCAQEGVLQKIFVLEGDIVEYGQPLFLVQDGVEV